MTSGREYGNAEWDVKQYRISQGHCYPKTADRLAIPTH